MTCEPCEYFAKHKWIGPGRSHCSKCHRTWTAKNQAHCTVCHRHFSAVSAADLHLRVHDDGERVEHRDPATIKDKHGQHKLVKRYDRWGAVWGRPGQAPEWVLSADGNAEKPIEGDSESTSTREAPTTVLEAK